MAYYAIAPLLCVLAQNELYMHLYIDQVFAGQNTNQIVVINSSKPHGFGTTAITDWPITDGPAPKDATTVGRAQGFHFQSGQTNEKWYTSMNLIFEDTRFKGSTLQVMGTIPQDGQWSIIGGTGEFVSARGIVDHKVIKQQGSEARTYELKIHAFYTPMQSSGVGCNTWKLGN